MADYDQSKRPSGFRNWISLAGAVIAAASLFSFILLFVLDSLAHFSNPYIGILTYCVAPMFLFAGIFLIVFGFWLARRRGRVPGPLPTIHIDLGRQRDRRILGWFIVGSVGFLLLSAIGSYQTYHFTESVTFCAQACHTVMGPERITHQLGSHARVACVECHVGPGAEYFVKSKIAGTHQLIGVIMNNYPKPVPTPVKNLRPARETCEQCHWPEKFVGNKIRTYDYFLGDETNTHHEVKLLLKVGGANPDHGPISGIHWHVYAGHKVEYIASDESRETIPWVRMTDEQGVVTEYKTAGFTNDLGKYEIRTMDCIDCHNRPAHRYRTPSDAVNQAMLLGEIDPALPWIKTNAVSLLIQTYKTEDEAIQNIATTLNADYSGDARSKSAIAAVQKIYRQNFFPQMNASWKDYPEHIGHKNWPGCARCHDDEHKSADGKKKIGFSDCTMCHSILAQGTGKQLATFSALGEPFVHPADEIPDGYKCHECHTGGL